MEIENCAAIVTGGASGIGAATAKMLSQHGVKVAILDLNQEAADKVAAEMNALAIACDVTQPDRVRAAIATAQEKHGVARICINCAGIVYGKKLVTMGDKHPVPELMPIEELKRVMDINFLGTTIVMMNVVAAMLSLPTIGNSGERGVIINTASVAAFEGQIGQVAYSASKGAIVSMTLPAARELAPFGIRVMTIAPGLVDTPMFEKIPPEARASLAAMVPFPKRLARPEEYASLALQIIENPMLNGEVIRLDGGLRMQEK